LRELQEEWTYDEIMRASAVLDMYAAVDTAREAYDKAELEDERRKGERLKRMPEGSVKTAGG
jgi:hypothetical protein